MRKHEIMHQQKKSALSQNSKRLKNNSNDSISGKSGKNNKSKLLVNQVPSQLQRNLKLTFYICTICTLGSVTSAYADWFQVNNIKNNLIVPVYNLVNDNLGFIAFAIGGVMTFLARGQDMYQKALAFGAGSLGTAAAVKLAQTVLHLP